MKTKIQDEAKEKGLHKGGEDQNPDQSEEKKMLLNDYQPLKIVMPVTLMDS
jgi:hypothetical protein